MKVQIEGCTQEALSECSNYLTLGKEYTVISDHEDFCYVLEDDTGEKIVCGKRICAHLPDGAQWVKVE